MKRRAIAAFLFAMLFPAIWAEDIRVFIDDNYPPYSFRDENGALQGILIDQWAEWERQTGTGVELLGMSWPSALSLMESERDAVIDPIFSLPEREGLYAFTKPFAEIEVSVFVHESVTGVGGIGDLDGFDVAVKRGDACVGRLERAGIDNLVFFDDYAEIIARAKKLEFRVFCMDKPPALYLMNRLALDREYRAAFTLYTGRLCRAVRKDNAELLSRIQKGFDAIPSERYLAIERNWLGSSIIPDALGSPLSVSVFVALGVCLILLATVVSLSRKVRHAGVELDRHAHRFEASEKRNRAIIAAFPDLFFIIDRKGHYVDYYTPDKSIVRTTGKGLIGKSLGDILEPDTERRFREAIASVLDGGDSEQIEYGLDVPAGRRVFDSRIVALDDDKVLCFARDITKRIEHERDLVKSLREKEALLRELHHRVKNNLQVVSSLIALQEETFVSDHDRGLMQETQFRIQAMAQLHELLYQSSGVDSIDSREYLSCLIDELAVAWHRAERRVELRKDIAALPIRLESALPLGFIANELVSNGLRYAFRESSPGVLRVSLRDEGDCVALQVYADSLDVVPDFTRLPASALSHSLIRELSQQLGGTISVENGADIGMTVRFPLSVLGSHGNAAPPGESATC